MLHQEAVAAPTLELLKSLQARTYLKDFHLVGGTALALYYGHRKSIDLDLFTNAGFETAYLQEQLINEFSYQLSFSAKHTLKGNIHGINVDLLTHAYPYLEKPHVYDQISLLSEQDIIAMKLNAISISGQRSKDFIDIYYALRRFSLQEMLSFYKQKYKQYNTSFVLKSLIYFEDVDLADWPVLLEDKNLKWNTVKHLLKKEASRLLQ